MPKTQIPWKRHRHRDLYAACAADAGRIRLRRQRGAAVDDRLGDEKRRQRSRDSFDSRGGRVHRPDRLWECHAARVHRHMEQRQVHGDFASNKLVNGQELGTKTITDLVVVSTAIQQTTSVQIPADSEVVGISSHVAVKPPGTLTMDVGVAGSGISRKRMAPIFPQMPNGARRHESPGVSYLAAASIVLSFDNTPSDNSGRIRLTIH